jgi:hypothetical protein
MFTFSSFRVPALAASALAVVAAVACNSGGSTATTEATTAHEAVGDTTKSGAISTALHAGSIEAGRDVYRYETFGDESFWTDAARMPQGMKAAKLTVLQALQAGVNFDADAIPAALKITLASEVKTDHSPAKAPNLNDPGILDQLVRANAVIGMVPKGGKVGVTCALCHAVTDKSVYELTGKGTIGKRIDGPTQHSLNVGKLLAAIRGPFSPPRSWWGPMAAPSAAPQKA